MRRLRADFGCPRCTKHPWTQISPVYHISADSGVQAAAVINRRDPRLGRPGSPAAPGDWFRLSWHISAGDRWVQSAGPPPRGAGLLQKIRTNSSATSSFWFVAFRSAESNNAAAARWWLGGAFGPFHAAWLHRFRPLGLPEPWSERVSKSRLAGLAACEYFAVNALSSPRNTLNFPIHLRGH